MSKVDAQRAMREANYAARQRAAIPSAAPTPAAVEPTVPKRTRVAKPVAAPAGARCGHKSMNGRECTRAAGHAEKSHRYS